MQNDDCKTELATKNQDLTLTFLSEIAKVLTQNADAAKVVEELGKIFNSKTNSDSLCIFNYDDTTGTIRDFSKSWLIVDELYDAAYSAKLYSYLKEIRGYDFILNNNFYKLDDVENLQSKCDVSEREFELFFPLIRDNEPYGLIELKFKNNIKELLTKDFFKILLITAYQISLKIQNKILQEKMQLNIDFHEAMKNIAKIIETQYELNYIIPLIGEMIDKFIADHLIYIFLKKQGDVFELVWPLACRDQNVLTIIKSLNDNSTYILTDNDKMGIFPLVGENRLLGCIVAHSNVDKLTQSEIDYILQLTNQSSITIHRANLYAEVLQHATMDALTGLNNRRQFEIRLKQEVATAKRQKTPLCAMMLDVDFFKSVNDTYGHQAGDEVLKNIAEVIKIQMRESDICSRYGGEEFSVLLPHTKIEDAFNVAQRLRVAVEKHEVDVSHLKNAKVDSIKVTVSIGVYEFQEDNTAEELYGNADKALYTAKTTGRNRVVIYNDKAEVQ